MERLKRGIYVAKGEYLGAKRGYKRGQKGDIGGRIVIGKFEKGYICGQKGIIGSQKWIYKGPKGRHRRPYSDWEG